MSSILGMFRSTLAKKAVMAVTGIALFGFVLVHMLGNLKMYLGEAKFDHYAEGLRELGAPFFGHGQLLWILRLVMLACAVLHVTSAWQLTRQSWRARPQAYAVKEWVQATYAARTMRWGGLILLFFILYHLAHLTLGWVHPDFVEGKAYQNVVIGFQVWWVSCFYIAANLALGLHLYHGLWSLFQTLGWNNPRWNPWRRRFATLFATLITVGNVSFPVAVLSGLVR